MNKYALSYILLFSEKHKLNFNLKFIIYNVISDLFYLMYLSLIYIPMSLTGNSFNYSCRCELNTVPLH